MGDNYKILKSGSSGNCILLRDYIALDMGISFNLIKPYIKDLKLVFISHCHKDHLLPSTVRTLAFNKPNLKWCVGRFLVDTLLKLGVAAKNIFVLDVGKKYDLGAIEVEPVELHHDVENNRI